MEAGKGKAQQFQAFPSPAYPEVKKGLPAEAASG